ncbi:MAG: hypothetical protein ABSG81_14175 [Acidimicrobiales bacterium]
MSQTERPPTSGGASARSRRVTFILSLLAGAALFAGAAVQGNIPLFVGAGVFTLFICALYVFLWTARPHGQALWRAPMQFNRFLLGNRELFPEMHIGRGPRTFLAGGKVGGRMEVQAGGLHWKAGSALMVGMNKASGTLEFPWAQISHLSVTNVPYRISWLGGILEIQLAESNVTLQGEFLGSQQALRAAIETGSNGKF